MAERECEKGHGGRGSWGLSLYEVFTCTASKPDSFINNCVEYEVPEKELVTFGIDFKQRQPRML